MTAATLTDKVVMTDTPAPKSGALQVENLRKTYGAESSPAVADLSLRVDPGDFVAFLGPSGCGKTTTLRMIAGLLEPTSGRIRVNDNDITHVPVHKRQMGMVFQSYALFPHMTVAQNVGFGLEMRNVEKSERYRRIQTALDMVELGHLGRRKVQALSGGQQQRIALARALVVEPTLLLLDEPLSNLDAKLRDTMRTEIKRIQEELRITTLFVTHDQDEALYMADRIAIMYNGVVEQFGTPYEVYERPESEFVASFVGRANLLEVEVTAGSSTINNESTYEYSSPLIGTGKSVGPAALSPGRNKLLIRPHRLTIGPEDARTGSPGHHSVRGSVKLRGYTGDMLMLELDVAGETLTAEVPTTETWLPRVGDAVSISWRPEQTYLIPRGDESSV
ncbi:putative spermidine/putrescine transport system ATP-binding protein [Brevibacterium siliguriense]|uniref:ABC-type quaternary amine transporter n=2 Tax=Brevibacterium siliguriense TaxID=1136497 RepID=A0A1H1SM67_9MICO|nr:putative spermidine/putrescine transport system ATP-binding protein [Brevibacterium siliguriense]